MLSDSEEGGPREARPAAQRLSSQGREHAASSSQMAAGTNLVVVPLRSALLALSSDHQPYVRVSRGMAIAWDGAVALSGAVGCQLHAGSFPRASSNALSFHPWVNDRHIVCGSHGGLQSVQRAGPVAAVNEQQVGDPAARSRQRWERRSCRVPRQRQPVANEFLSVQAGRATPEAAPVLLSRQLLHSLVGWLDHSLCVTPAHPVRQEARKGAQSGDRKKEKEGRSMSWLLRLSAVLKATAHLPRSS
jgi:hypothetical protein